MYIFVFINVFSLSTILLGLKIILEHNYIIYYDPALLIIFSIVWASGSICYTLLSFIVMKFKVYHLKEEVKGRAKLENVEKILKKNDFTEYLEL